MANFEREFFLKLSDSTEFPSADCPAQGSRFSINVISPPRRADADTTLVSECAKITIVQYHEPISKYAHPDRYPQ